MFTKESMYTPMKNLKEAYPEWLEKNWESLSEEDLERYNEHQDKINEIFKDVMKNNNQENTNMIFNTNGL